MKNFIPWMENTISICAALILLSEALGWKLGIGITFLAYFHKKKSDEYS